MRNPALFCVLTILAVRCQSVAGETLYQVGNQLTWDSGPASIEESATLAGRELSIGYHIRNSSSLQTIVDSPTSVTIAPTDYGLFSEALPNSDWDYISLQSYPFGNMNVVKKTLGDDLNAANYLINLAESAGRNSDTAYYVYTSWQAFSGWNDWLKWVPDDLNVVSNSRLFYERLVNRLRSEHGSERVFMIPVGDVLYQLRQELAAGAVPGYTDIAELFSGSSLNAIGDYVASATVLSTVLKVDPRGLPLPSQFPSLPAETAAAFQKTVWDVVNFHPYSGVAIPEPGDFDGDGDGDDNDLEMWRESFGSTTNLAADADNDGRVNAADYVIWRNKYTGSNRRTRMYQIGNSLTGNSEPFGTEQMARSLGYPLDVGIHLRSGASLSSILADPDSVNFPLTYFGPFYSALVEHEWDFVTLQSFPSYVGNDTLGEDHVAANELIQLTQSNPLNDDTLFYIYTSWPHHHTWHSWDIEIPDEDDVTEVSRQTFEHLVNRLRADNGEDRIFMIPVGDVLFELKQDIDAGLIPGLTQISDLYRDLRHLNGIGEFIASTTVMATVLKQDPRGVTVPPLLASANLTEELVAIFQEKVWDVVNFHPYSGVAVPPGGSAASIPEPSAVGLSLVCSVLASLCLPRVRMVRHAA